MPDEGIHVRRLDDLRGAGERGVGVAVVPDRDDRRLLRQLVGTGREAALLWDAVAPSSHFTFSFVRAVCACHQLSATIATPGCSPSSSVVPSTMNACRTPGMALISSRLALTTLPMNTGHFSNTAYSMPGIVKSMLKIGLPVTIARLSTPGIGLPMILKSFGSFRVTVLSSGGVSVAALAASGP